MRYGLLLSLMLNTPALAMHDYQPRKENCMKTLIVAVVATLSLSTYAMSRAEYCGPVSELGEVLQLSRKANIPGYKNSGDAYNKMLSMLSESNSLPSDIALNKKLASFVAETVFMFPKDTSPARVSEHVNTRCLINPPMAT